MNLIVRSLFIKIAFFCCFSISAQNPYTGTAPYVGENGGIMINEISQGDSGVKEFIEFVVLGSPSNPTAAVDLSEFIFDDNNFPGSGNATSPGHFRFGDCYDAVPPGSILVLYNASDVNASMPAADPEDADGDGVYIIPHNSSCMSLCESNPASSPPNEFHCPCTTFGANDWESIVMRNGGDILQIRDGCGVLHHALMYGSQLITTEVNGSPVYVNTGFGSQSGSALWFDHSVSDDWLNVNNYATGPVATNETPGDPNNMANDTWIQSIIDGSYSYDGEIADCRKTDAGELDWPSDGDPGAGATLEICEGNDISAFNPDWSGPGLEEPDGSLFNFEYGFVLSESNPPYTILDYNLSGDFDFSTLPPGSYRVWGLSFLYVNSEEDILSFLDDACISDVETISDYEACDYDCGIDVDLTNFSTYGDEILIEIIPAPDDPTDPMIGPLCPSEAENYDLTALIDIINNGTGLSVVFYDGDPGSGGTEIADPTAADLTNIDLWIRYGDAPCTIDFDLSDPMITSGPTLDPIGPFTLCIPVGAGSTQIDLTTYHDDLNSTPGLNFNWYEDAGLTQLISTPSMYVLNTGITTLYVQAEDGGCPSNTVPVEFSIVNRPDITAGLSLEGCEPAPDNFDLTELEPDLNANPAFTFNWFENANGSGTISNPTDYASAGGNIYASVTDPVSGCTSDTVSVELILNPAPDFDVINDVTVCEGLEVDLDTVVDPTNPNLSYTFHDGFPPNTGNQITGPVAFTSNSTIWVVGTDDDTGCSSVEEVSVEVIDIPVTPPIENTGPYCEGETIELNYTFPIPIPFLEFNWTGPNGFNSSEEDPRIPNAPPAADGVYSLVVSLFGCSSQPATTTVVVTPLPILNPETPIEICQGEPLELMVDGPAGTQYSWSGPNGFSSTAQNPTVTSSAEPQNAGDYIVSGTRNGCVGPDTIVEVTIFEGPDIELNIDNPVQCAGGDSGEISVVINSGNGPFQYSWSDPQYDGLSQISDLTAGVYEVTVTDDNNCTSTAQIELTEPDPILLFCTEIGGESFPGAEDGIGGVDISGGTAPYSLSYDNNDGTAGTLNGLGTGTAEINDLPAGTYEVEVLDANGCEATCSFTITDPGCEVQIEDLFVSAEILCFGDSTAVIEADMSGGSGTYVYNWTNSNGDFVGVSNPLSGVPADIYTLTVADAFDLDCERSLQIEVSEPDPLEISCEILSEVSAPGAGDGEIQVTFSGGTPEYDITINGALLSNVTSPLIIDTLSSGTYLIEITDANGCTIDCSLTLSPPNCDLEILNIMLIDTLACLGDSTGRATADIVGGPTGNYLLYWVDVASQDTLGTMDTIDNLSAGLYELVVVDENCMVSDSIRIDENPNALQILNCEVILPVSAPGNSDGQVEVSWIGGQAGMPPAYTLQLSGPIDTTIAVNGLSYIFDSLPAGPYTVILEDSIPCTQSCSFILNDTPCDLSIELDTAYFSGCPSDSTLFVSLVPTPLDSHTILIWNADTLTQNNRSNLAAGDYLIQYIDTLTGCRDSLSLSYPSPPLPTLDCFISELPSQTGATDGSIGFAVEGVASPYDAKLSGPQGTLDSTNLRFDTLIWFDLAAGNYTITITDSLSCTYSCSLDLSAGSCLLDINLDTAYFSGCPSDSTLFIRLSATDTTEHTIYSWNGEPLNTLQQSNLAAGSYQIIALDTLSMCADTLELTRIDSSALEFNCEVFAIPSNFGGGDGQAGIIIDSISEPARVTLTGFNTFEEVNGMLGDTVLFSNLDSGNYLITVENSFGCIDTCSFFMPNGGCGIFSIDSIVVRPPDCATPENGAIEVFVSGGSGDYTFDWGVDSLRNQNPIFNAAPGNYALSVRDTTLNCLAMGTTFVPEAEDLTPTVIFPGDVCQNEPVSISINDLNGLPPYQLLIDGDTVQQFSADTILEIFAYSGTLSIRDAGTCSYSDDFSVAELPLAQSLIDRVLCPGDSLVIGDSTFTELNPIGIVTLEGAAANGCDSVISVNLTFDALSVEWSLAPPDCINNLTTLLQIDSIAGTAPFQLQLNGQVLTIENLPIRFDGQPGTNTFIVLDARGCVSDTFTFEGEEIQPLDIEILGPASIALGDTAALSVSPANLLSDLVWTPDDMLSCPDCPSPFAFPLRTTTIQVMAIDTNGCPVEALFNLRVLEPGEDIYIPNVFSPNGDGINDFFSLFGAPGSGSIRSLRIFDRWGNQLFERQNIPINAPSAGWNGRVWGEPMSPGVYVYSFEFRHADGEIQFFRGTVTVVE